MPASQKTDRPTTDHKTIMKLKWTLVALCIACINVVDGAASHNSSNDNCLELSVEDRELNENGLKNTECADANDSCQGWANNRECVLNPQFMLEECPKSCSVCNEDEPVDNGPCHDTHKKCEYWETKNQCVKNPGYMLLKCPRVCKACPSSITDTIDFGLRQKEEDENVPLSHIKAIARQSKIYMRKVLADPSFASVRELCRNGNEMCSIWAAQGECKNPSVRLLCGPACQSCDVLDVNRNCSSISKAVDAFQNADDLTNMFARIADSKEFAVYKPNVIYSPFYQARERKTRAGPWFMSFDNFLTSEEAEKLIEHGKRRGYGKSEEVSIKPQPDGSYNFYASSYRSSSTSWCDKMCEEDPVIQRVLGRVANMTGLPQDNSEPFQLLRYEKDQRYGIHHDYIESQKFRPCGVRILTFFFYLNDEFEGGETNFVFMHNLTFVPQKGKALLWTNVLSKDPNEEDELLDHQALPVVRGIKYAANIWIHQRNFRSAFDRQCS